MKSSRSTSATVAKATSTSRPSPSTVPGDAESATGPLARESLALTAPLPEHMKKTWELLGLDAERYEKDE